MTRFAITNFTIDKFLAHQVLELSIFLLELVYVERRFSEDGLHSVHLLYRILFPLRRWYVFVTLDFHEL